MEGVFFEVHGNEFKPDPLGDLGKASDEGVTHPVLLLRICETPLDDPAALSHQHCI